MAEDRESWEWYRATIDERLDGLRPERAAVGEKEWREPVYGWARNHIPNEAHLVRHFAEQEVDRREGQATKRGNDYIRQWAKGQRPLLWSDLGALPIKVEKLRVRLDAATPDDVEDAAREMARKGKIVYDEIIVLTEAMHDLARIARRAGFTSVAEIGDLNACPNGNDDLDDEDEDEDDEDE